MSYKVLVVVDRAETRLELLDLLQKCHCIVETADGPTHAIAVAQRVRPRVVFLDFYNTSLGAIELTQLLREQAELSESKIVAISPSGRESEAAGMAGIDHFISTPITLRDLQLVLYGNMPAAVGAKHTVRQ